MKEEKKTVPIERLVCGYTVTETNSMKDPSEGEGKERPA